MSEITFYDRWGKIRPPRATDVIKNRTGAFAIAVAENSLLLTWQAHATEVPELPGGGADPGENLWTAMAREFYEETGITLTMPELAPTYRQQVGFYADDDNEYWRYDQTYFLLHGTEVNVMFFMDERTSPEHGKVMWVDFAKAKSLPIHYCHSIALQNCIFDSKSGPGLRRGDD